MSVLIWPKGQGSEGHEQEVQQLFESNGWPWNVEVTDVCEIESAALSTSLDKLLYSNCPQLKAFES